MLEEWMKECEKLHIDEQDNKMDVKENLACWVRTTESHDNDNKKLVMIIKIKIAGNFHGLKQKFRKLCTDESLWMTQKYSAFENFKRIDVLVGPCIPH